MKAAYIDRVGPPENIQFGERPDPAVGPSDVLVTADHVRLAPDLRVTSGRR